MAFTNEKVSVIITTFNVEKYISQAIQSVVNQTYTNLEIVIVDDCSSDETVKRIREMKIPNLILEINEENYGPSYSRNRAVQLASGDWIAILAGDDWWAPERIEECIRYSCENRVNIVCDNILYTLDGHNQSYFDLFRERGLSEKFPGSLTIEDYISYDLGILQPVIRRDLLIKNRIEYLTDYRYGEDFLFLLDCLLVGEMYVLSKGYYYYRTRKGSLVSSGTALYQGVIESTLHYMNLRKATLSPEILKLLNKRVKYIEKELQLSLLRDDLKSKNILSPIKYFIPNPSLLLMLSKKLYVRLRIFINKRVHQME